MGTFKEREEKNSRRSSLRGRGFGVLDVFVIVALAAIVLAAALRFIPLEKMAGNRHDFRVELSVVKADVAQLTVGGLAEGTELRNGDGDVIGTVLSCNVVPSRIESVAGESIVGIPYPADTYVNITIVMKCVLTDSAAGRLDAGGEPVAVGREMSLHTRLAQFDGKVKNVSPLQAAG